MKRSQLIVVLVLLAAAAVGVWLYFRKRDAVLVVGRPPLPAPVPTPQGTIATILATPPSALAAGALQYGATALGDYLAGLGATKPLVAVKPTAAQYAAYRPY